MKIENLIGSIGGDLKDELVEELLHRSRRKVDTALKRIRRPQAAVGVVKSPLGDLLVATSARGVALAHYLHDDSDLTVSVHHHKITITIYNSLEVNETQFSIVSSRESRLFGASARGASDVERPHGELGSRLSNRLGSDNTNSLSHIHHSPSG